MKLAVGIMCLVESKFRRCSIGQVLAILLEVGIKRSGRKGTHFVPLRKMNREEIKKYFRQELMVGSPTSTAKLRSILLNDTDTRLSEPVPP